MLSPQARISQEQLAALARLDTCSIANAIETFEVRLRNAGFADSRIRCMSPALPPMVGYAVTGRIRCSLPPTYGPTYQDRTDWWNFILTVPAPRVAVIQDVDRNPGLGAFVGEVHCSILKALGCAGYVTNGTVRHLPAVEAMGFQLFAGGPAVSHAFAHLIDFGGAVEVGGLTVLTGDLLHGDQHGVLNVPQQIAGEIPSVVNQMAGQRREIIEFCTSPKFSVEGLRDLIKQQP